MASPKADSNSPVPALPLDLVQRIFSAKADRSGSDTVIPLEQRLRCQLVSKAWRAALGPRALPVPWLTLNMDPREHSNDRMQALAEWVCRVKPKVESADLTVGDEPSSRLAQAGHKALLSLDPQARAARMPCCESAPPCQRPWLSLCTCHLADVWQCGSTAGSAFACNKLQPACIRVCSLPALCHLSSAAERRRCRQSSSLYLKKRCSTGMHMASGPQHLDSG